MAKRNWTPEERKAFGDKMKAARQNKNPQIKTEVTEQPVIKEGQTIGMAEYQDLLRQINELKQNQFTDLIQALKGNPDTVVGNGKLTGTFEKYITSADRYPSPVDRLMVEHKLQRFAFPLNYELIYGVSVSEYETIDHVRTKEPKFSLTLVRIVLDEETGEPTNKRYEICRLVMHEDPEAALVIARDNDLVVEEENEEKFLNEMRYIRMRDWLLECFYPAPIKSESNRRESVIGGKLVMTYEKTNESGVGVGKMDWDEIAKNKL